MTYKLHLLRLGRKVYAVLFDARGHGHTLSVHRNKRAAKKWCSANGYQFFWAGAV